MYKAENLKWDLLTHLNNEDEKNPDKSVDILPFLQSMPYWLQSGIEIETTIHELFKHDLGKRGLIHSSFNLAEINRSNLYTKRTIPVNITIHGKKFLKEQNTGIQKHVTTINPDSKFNIFLSYFHGDEHKVNLIIEELKNHEYFGLTVIASNREALKPLANKVVEGLANSEIIIPLLTNKSISTQWINQEIGFAKALDKKIKPIVESEIIDDLKGFIHKQIDLPYRFKKNLNAEQENEDFMICFRTLIADLEKEYKFNPAQKKVNITKPTMLDKAKEIKTKIESIKRREQILKSPETINSAEIAVDDIFKIINDRVELLKAESINFQRVQTGSSPKSYVIQSEQHSVLVKWNEDFKWDKGICTLNNSKLVVNLCDGHILKDNPNRKPLSNTIVYEYAFDIDEKTNELGWKKFTDKKFYTNDDIGEVCINWILDRISENIS